VWGVGTLPYAPNRLAVRVNGRSALFGLKHRTTQKVRLFHAELSSAELEACEGAGDELSGGTVMPMRPGHVRLRLEALVW
jgi:hypothetical protein